MQLAYHVVDVFTQKPLEGNALAVFPDSRQLDDATMQDIAREMNLSETTFVLPSTRVDCVANVRIFTPNYEMEFAGHPTIGTSHVLQEEGLVPHGETAFTLEEKVGAVPVRIEAGDDPLIWLQTPAISTGERFDRAACAAALGLNANDLIPEIPCELWTAGNPNIFVAVRDRSIVDCAWLDATRFRVLSPNVDAKNCVFVFAPTQQGAYSRMFAPEHGIVEDPATGSAAGPLAAYMMKYGLMPRADGTRFVSEQGTKMRRRSFLHVLVHGEGGNKGIEVGGYVTAVTRATMTLDRK